MRIGPHRLGLVSLVALVCWVNIGCKRDAAPKPASYLDPTIERHYVLGWLGGAAHPATRTVTIPGASGRTTGGVVVTEVSADGVLAQHGVKRGDVIVRVGETWVPNRENPFLDVIRSVEAEVSAGVSTIDLGLVRGNTFVEVQVAYERMPFELGLPGASRRLAHMVRAGLKYLAVELSTSTGPSDLSERVALNSLAGLAFIAGGAHADDAPHAAALASCRSVVEQDVLTHAEDLDAWSAAWATIFLAELQGPPEIGGGHFVAGVGEALTLPEMPEGALSMHGLPEGAVVTSFVIGGDDDGGVPEGIDLGELQNGGGSFMVMGGPLTPEHASGGAAANHEPMGDEPLWSIDELKALAGDDIEQALSGVEASARRLMALQGVDGGWDPVDERVGYSERTVLTNHALLALGTAGGAGVPIPGSVLKRGLEYVRKKTNDGHVHSVSQRGFDRRLEAGRSSGAAAALIALDCVDNDAFFKELVHYSDDHAQDLPAARGAISLHVFNTAVLSRQRGLSAWAVFFDEFRHVIASLQQADGSFALLAVETPDDPYTTLYAARAMRTALWSLIAGMQEDHTPLLTAATRHPLQRQITSAGQVVAGPPAKMMGGQAMDPEQAREMLEKMGIDMDDVLKQAMEQHGKGE